MKQLGYGTVPLLIARLLSACASGARVISGFGDLRDGEGKPRSGPHGGVDVGGYPGEPVLAPANGQVQDVGEESGVRWPRSVTTNRRTRLLTVFEGLGGESGMYQEVDSDRKGRYGLL